MSQSLTERYNEQIAGVLSCYDRLVITGTLPGICYADGMTRFLHASGIRIFDYPQFAMELRDRVRDCAASLAAEAGVTIEHIGKAHIRKEAVVTRVLEQRGDRPGLVHIISAMEDCDAYQPWHDKQTDLRSTGQRQVPALLLLLPGRQIRTDLPAGADVVPVPPAVLLQWPQLAGTSADSERHRLHDG